MFYTLLIMKPIHEMIFKEVQGVWRNVAGDSAILADVLTAFELQIDDRCEFARFKDYNNGLEIYYRRNGGKITLTLWKLETK